MTTTSLTEKSPFTDSFTAHDGLGIYLSFRFSEPFASKNPLIPVLTLTTIVAHDGKIIKEYLPPCNIKSAESANIPWHRILFPDGIPVAKVVTETVFIVNQTPANFASIQIYLGQCATEWSLGGSKGKKVAFHTADCVFLASNRTEVRMRKEVAL